MKNISSGAHFVPAIGENIIRNWYDNKTCKGRSLKIYDVTSNSFFHHDFILMSAFHLIKSNDMEHRKNINYPDNLITIGDSGGFQVMSFEKKNKSMDITPLQILRWLEANVDIGMNLDVPPTNNFGPSLKKSVDNFRLFEENRKNYDFALYNVLHGRTLDQISDWYNAVKDFNFDGWAIGVRPNTNVYLKIIAYLYLLDKGENSLLERTHFFGVSGPISMLALTLLSNKCNSNITFDSSSWSWGQRFRDYYFPLNIRNNVRLGRNFANKMIGIPCDCPICQEMTIQDLYDQSNPDTPLLLLLHNLYQYIEVNRMINILVDDDEALSSYCRSCGLYESYISINNILKDYFINEKTIHEIYNNYKPLFSQKTNDKITYQLSSFV